MIMSALALSFFLLGLSFGAGPCMASCGPILLSYIVGTGKDTEKSVVSYALFSISRVSVYLVLGVLVFWAGKFITENLVNTISKYVYIGGGIFVVLMGVLMISGNRIEWGVCSFLHKKLLHHDKKSVLLLGLVTGFAPCAPLLALFSYIALVSKSWVTSVIYALSFGIGTIISPLLLLAAFAGLIPSLLKGKSELFGRIFNVLCGVIIIILGLRLIFR